MAFLEVSAGSAESRIAVSFRSIANITTFSVPFITFFTTNLRPERILELDLVIDGTTYTIRLEFEDEAYHSRDFLGLLKKDPPPQPGLETPTGARPEEPATTRGVA